MKDSEKLILLMLSEIYENLEIDSSEVNPGFIKSAIFTDNTWGITWEYSMILSEETPVEVKDVVDILDMWDFIEESYQNLSNKEKIELKNKSEVWGEKPKFDGFDGNNESKYKSIADFLINDLNRFQIFKGRYLNSHTRTIERYKRMFLTFDHMRKGLVSRLLSVNQLVEILERQNYHK